MTERQQLRQVCAWNRQLSRENSELRAELRRARGEIADLEGIVAKSDSQTEAAECFLDAAMTEAQRARR